jgi:hypothetical protein
MAARSKTTASAKTSHPVTVKHLTTSLAEEHKLTKRQCETLRSDLVDLLTKHLKNLVKIRIMLRRLAASASS